jgi:hypothetical protein
MEYDFNPISLEALFSLQELAAAGRADTAAVVANFRTQRQTDRLREYCNEIFSGIKLSPRSSDEAAFNESEGLADLAAPPATDARTTYEIAS